MSGYTCMHGATGCPLCTMDAGTTPAPRTRFKPPISAAAAHDHAKRPRLVRDWACRHCGNTAGSKGDRHERLCPRCFTVFNQGVGVGRACEALSDAAIDRLTAVVCETWEAGQAAAEIGISEEQAAGEAVRDPAWLDAYAAEHRELYEIGEKEREWHAWRRHVLAALGIEALP